METAVQTVLKPTFLTLKEVMDIHDDMVRRYGGKRGIRDSALLESSITMPRSGIVGQYLHNGLFEMAAAYLFHFSRNRPFHAANDRTAVTAALVFLRVNGHEVHGDLQEFRDLVSAVVQHKAGKDIVTWFLRAHSKPIDPPVTPETAAEALPPASET